MRGELIAVPDLAAADRSAMQGLLDRHFENVETQAFDQDLANKDWALLFFQDDGALGGFTTIGIERHQMEGREVAVVFSGDTIVDPSCWGSTALARHWIAAIRHLRSLLGVPLIWLLICSGYRTYRFLPLFFKDFYPRHDRQTPDAIQEAMGRFAASRYGAGFDRQTGIVRLDNPQPLRSHLTEVRGTRRDAHIEFFLETNRGHIDGDELVCYCPLDDDNLTRAGWRMVRAGSAAPLSEAAE